MPGFGYTPFGRRPFSTRVSLPVPTVTAATSSANGYVFTLEIYPVSGTPIYAASEQYNTRPGDIPSSTPFNGTLDKGLRFHRAIIDGSRIGGMSSGVSDFVLSNAGGEYDSYAELLDGARLVFRIGPRGGAFPEFQKMFDGLVNGTAQIDEEALTLHAYDDNKRLEIPAQPSVYGGTGGIDGDANVKGKRKPISLGLPPNVSCPLIDAVNLIYQIHDGAITSIGHVYDRGVELTANSTPDYANYSALVAATVTPGKFASCLALGIFRLGAKPDGVVTVTAQGASNNGLVAGGGAVGATLSDTASLVHYLISISTAAVIVDAGSVITTKAAQSAAIGYWIGPDDNKTLRQAIDDLMYGILGWAGFRRDRVFDMGLIVLPSGTGLGDYTEKDFYSLKKLQLPSIMSPPPYRVRAAYSLNWTVQTDIDATVDAGTQTLRKDQYSIASSTNSSLSATIQAAHPQAQDPDVWPSYFVNSSDAVTFCNTQLTFFGAAARGLYEITLPADGYGLNLGSPINVTDDRYGLSLGRLLALVSTDDNVSDEEAIIQGIG